MMCPTGDRVRIWLLCAALTCSWASPAAAAPSASERETTRGLLAEGDRLHAAGDLRGALSCYRSARAIIRVPTICLDVAQVEAELGMLVEARSSAMEAANLPASAGEPAVFGQARLTAHALAESLEPRVPSLKTSVKPADAAYTLSIDNVALPAEARGVAFRTDPGTHQVRVEAPGYEVHNVQVELTEGQPFALAVILKPSAAAGVPAPAQTPAPVVASAPVYSSRLMPQSLPPPRRDGAQADNSGSGGRTRGIIAVSVGGAALLVGLVTAYAALLDSIALEGACTSDKHCLKNMQSDITEAKTLATITNVCIPVGLVGVGYGLYEILTAHKRPAQDRAQGVHVELTATGAMLRGSL